jgi:hypothetical protein
MSETTKKDNRRFPVREEDLHLFTKEYATSTYTAKKLKQSLLNQESHLYMMEFTKHYNPEAIKKLLLDPEYYETLLSVMKNPNMAMILASPTNDMSLAIPKSMLIDIFKNMIPTSNDSKDIQSHQILEETPMVRAKIQKLQNTISIDSIVETMPVYSKTVGNRTLSVNTQHIVDFINKVGASKLDYTTVSQMYGLPTQDFIYLVKAFTDDVKMHARYYLTQEQQQLISDHHHPEPNRTQRLLHTGNQIQKQGRRNREHQN